MERVQSVHDRRELLAGPGHDPLGEIDEGEVVEDLPECAECSNDGLVIVKPLETCV